MNRKYRVWYTCRQCGNDFFLIQGDDIPDEDVDLCWDCIDKLIGRPWQEERDPTDTPPYPQWKDGDVLCGLKGLSLSA